MIYSQTCDGSDLVKSMNLFPIQTQKKRLRMKHMNGLNYIITPTQPVDLGGWSIQWGTSSFSNSFTIPSGVSIDGESVLLIGGEGVSNPIPDVIVPADNDLVLAPEVPMPMLSDYCTVVLVLQIRLFMDLLQTMALLRIQMVGRTILEM